MPEAAAPDPPPVRSADKPIVVPSRDDEVVAARSTTFDVLRLQVAAAFGAIAVEPDMTLEIRCCDADNGVSAPRQVSSIAWYPWHGGMSSSRRRSPA